MPFYHIPTAGTGLRTLLPRPFFRCLYLGVAVLLLSAYSGGVSAETIRLGIDNSPYYFNNDFTVEAGDDLVVEAGVEIRVAGGVSMYIYGNADFQGTAAATVVIRSDNDSHRWGGICIDAGDGTIIFSHVMLSGATFGDPQDIFPAAVSVYSSDIYMESCSFGDCYDGIGVRDGFLTLTDSRFGDDIQGEYVAIKGGGADITGCTFRGSGFGDIVDFEDVEYAYINGCSLYDAGDDAIDIGENSSDIIIESTRIIGAADKGVSVGQHSGTELAGVVIAETDIGLAVFDGSAVTADHLTIASSRTGISCYASVGSTAGGEAVVSNSIIDADTSVAADGFSGIEVTYTLHREQLLPGTGNLLADPGFVDADTHNFHLQAGSPAIDAGNPDSPPDADGSRTDMGALTFSVKLLVINEIQYNAPAGNDTGDWVEIYNPNDESVSLAGWSLVDEDESHAFVFSEADVIGPDGYIVACRDTAGFRLLYPEVPCVGDFDFGYNSAGEHVGLFDANGVLVDSLTYDNNAPWPVEPDGGGSTLSLINPGLDNGIAVNWAASAGTGTPGAINDVHQTGVTDTPHPAAFRLERNYPNPFNGTTTIPFTLPGGATVRVDIFSVAGQHVGRIPPRTFPAGRHSLSLTAGRWSSGIFLYRVTANGHVRTGMMTFIK